MWRVQNIATLASMYEVLCIAPEGTAWGPKNPHPQVGLASLLWWHPNS